MPTARPVPPPRRPRRTIRPDLRSALATAMLLSALALGGCSGDSQETALRGQATPFTDCATACSGTIKNAKYQILLPETWNGTLLIYSHGYRAAFPTPPDNEPVQTAAEPAPGYSEGLTSVADELLARGYALAGSGFASNGWAVAEGIQANTDLYQRFTRTVGVPKRVYLWGDSMGGLITELMAESGPDWVSAAAPLCAPMAGLIPNMDLGLDLAVAYRTLLDPGFQVSGYRSAEAANAALLRAVKRIQAAAGAGGRDSAAVLALAAVVDANPKTANFDARDAASRVAGAAEAAAIGMAFSTGARFEAEQRYGGEISSNTGVDYQARFSPIDRAWIDKVGGAGTAARFITELQDAPRVSATDPDDQAAVVAAADTHPSGALDVPTIAVHTAADPLVLVQNQAVLAESAAGAGTQGNLLQVFSVPPRRFADDGPAPYGAGHCNFTRATRVGAIELLDEWLDSGTRPDSEQVTAAMPDSGIDPQYQPPAWPGSNQSP